MRRLALLLAAALAACSSSAPSSTVRAASDPAEACRELVADYCGAIAACYTPGARDGVRSDCAAHVYQAIYCADATALGATYGRCQADVRAISCGAVAEGMARDGVQWPASCDGAVVIPGAPDAG